MGIYSVVNSFNAGELSPKLLSRPELDAYGRGCQTLKNFIPTPYGSAERRPGFEMFDDALASSTYEPCRMLPFVFNDENSYVMYIYSNGAVFVRRYSAGTIQYWQASGRFVPQGSTFDPWKLSFAQSADVVFFAHPDFWPKKLSRTVTNGTVSFVLDDMAFNYPPVKDADTSGTKLKCSATEPGTSGATLTASASLFSSACVGQRYAILQRNKKNSKTSIEKSDSQSIASISWTRVKGQYTITTHGTWTGDVTIRRRYSSSTPSGSPSEDDETIGIYSSVNDFNVSLSGEEMEDDAWYYVQWSCSVTKSKCYVTLSNPGFEMTGVVLVTGYTSDTVATCTVERRLYKSNEFSSEWREAAFSPKNGYPQAVALYQERLFYAGTAENRERLWGSATNDWLDYEVIGNEDASAIDLTIASDTVARICWMQATDDLVIGTTEDEWTIGPSSGKDNALTASNVKVTRNSAYGSFYPCDAVMAQDRIIFVQKDGRRIRSMKYSWDSDTYEAEDITLLAEHLAKRGIREIHLAKSPDTVLWCVMLDGTVVSATIDAAQQVTAWAQCECAVPIESMCVLPNPSGDDYVYALSHVDMHSSGAIAPIGRLFPRDYSGTQSQTFLDFARRAEIAGAAHHGSSDRSSTYDWVIETIGGDTVIRPYTSFSDRNEYIGLAFLSDDGRMVVITEDMLSGPDFPDYAVLPFNAEGGWVGYPYESVLSPMPAEQQLQNGLSILHPKTVNRLRVDLYDTRGGKVRVNGGPWTRNLAHCADDMVDDLPTHSEIVVASPMGGHAPRIKVEVVQDEPWPMNVACISQTVSVEGY